VVLGGFAGIGAEAFAAVALGDDYIDTLVVDFNVVVGSILDLTDDLHLPLGPAMQAADASYTAMGFVGFMG